MIVWGLAAAALAACASSEDRRAGAPDGAERAAGALAREDCAGSDWFQVGERDGLYGEGAAKLEARRARCAEFGVAINDEDYRDGRARGLRTYCRPDRGFDAGRNGRDYLGVCPADAEAAFLAEYRIGRRLFDLSAALTTATSDRAAAEAKIGSNRFELSRALEVVGDGRHSVEERNAATAEIARLRQENAALEADMARLEAAIGAAEKALDAHRAMLERRAARDVRTD
jgi:hypothetical protein